MRARERVKWKQKELAAIVGQKQNHAAIEGLGLAFPPELRRLPSKNSWKCICRPVRKAPFLLIYISFSSSLFGLLFRCFVFTWYRSEDSTWKKREGSGGKRGGEVTLCRQVWICFFPSGFRGITLRSVRPFLL